MTLSEEFISTEDRIETAPTYPTAFGITFTPPISAALIAASGLALSVYMLMNLLMPAWQRNQELTASRTEKQNLVQQRSASLKQTEQIQAELAQAQQQKTEVLALFSNEQTLDTLLLDLNRLIQSANVQKNARAKLTKFVPANQTAEIISDNSFGAEVNGKLKRRSINITFEGTFEQTQAILRNIERLQPLLIVRDYKSNMTSAPTDDSNPKNSVVGGPTVITTSFQLQALIPASPAEVAPAEQKK